jgi:hypothetical protein
MSKNQIDTLILNPWAPIRWVVGSDILAVPQI